MNQQASKKFRQTFNRNFKSQIKESVEKIADKKIQDKIKKLENEVFIIARQRDIVFLIALGLLVYSVIYTIYNLIF